MFSVRGSLRFWARVPGDIHREVRRADATVGVIATFRWLETRGSCHWLHLPLRSAPIPKFRLTFPAAIQCYPSGGGSYAGYVHRCRCHRWCLFDRYRPNRCTGRPLAHGPSPLRRWRSIAARRPYLCNLGQPLVVRPRRLATRRLNQRRLSRCNGHMHYTWMLPQPWLWPWFPRLLVVAVFE
jgi:hypothetical protein